MHIKREELAKKRKSIDEKSGNREIKHPQGREKIESIQTVRGRGGKQRNNMPKTQTTAHT